ncbi:hypothetical protein OpiT1DRAFT_04396 [Opitutaceae bacterium TAV1]|nr:hypothetical protein OpiT1DRAFT_04396 [Opitutaceae bacterium TAV1]
MSSFTLLSIITPLGSQIDTPVRQQITDSDLPSANATANFVAACTYLYKCECD